MANLNEMKNKLTYQEFKKRRITFKESRPRYLQGLEDDFEEMTKYIYNNFYSKGKIPVYAKN